jgi:hypothetical protein
MSKPTFAVIVSPEKLPGLASQAGIDPSAKSGTLPEHEGVVLSYAVDGTTITFTVEKKPFLVPVSVIESRVKGLIGA